MSLKLKVGCSCKNSAGGVVTIVSKSVTEHCSYISSTHQIPPSYCHTYLSYCGKSYYENGKSVNSAEHDIVSVLPTTKDECLSLEVGSTYVDGWGDFVKIISKDDYNLEGIYFMSDFGVKYSSSGLYKGFPDSTKPVTSCSDKYNLVSKVSSTEDEVVAQADKPVDKTINPNQGRKYDAGKPMWDLLPADALEEVVKVLTIGAIKHNEPITQENWRLVDNGQSRYFSALQRHVWADKRGEHIDNGEGGTNCYHLACAIASLMFKLQLRIEADRKTPDQPKE